MEWLDCQFEGAVVLGFARLVIEGTEIHAVIIGYLGKSYAVYFNRLTRKMVSKEIP